MLDECQWPCRLYLLCDWMNIPIDVQWLPIHPWTTVEPLGPVWPLCLGTADTTDQANCCTPGFGQFSLISHHWTVVRQLSSSTESTSMEHLVGMIRSVTGQAAHDGWYRWCVHSWRFTSSYSASAVSHACGGTSRLRVVEVRPYHTTPASTALVEASMADRLQVASTRLQVPSRLGSVLPCRRTAPSSRLRVSKTSAFSFVTRTVCSPY